MPLRKPTDAFYRLAAGFTPPSSKNLPAAILLNFRWYPSPVVRCPVVRGPLPHHRPCHGWRGSGVIVDVFNQGPDWAPVPWEDWLATLVDGTRPDPARFRIMGFRVEP